MKCFFQKHPYFVKCKNTTISCRTYQVGALSDTRTLGRDSIVNNSSRKLSLCNACTFQNFKYASGSLSSRFILFERKEATEIVINNLTRTRKRLIVKCFSHFVSQWMIINNNHSCWRALQVVKTVKFCGIDLLLREIDSVCPTRKSS